MSQARDILHRSPSPSPAPLLPPMGSLRRSVVLFRAFRVEQSDPDRFYGLLAADSVREASRWCDLAGAAVLDVGGGPGYFADAFRAAGASYACVDPDVGELTARGHAGANTVRASGLRLPFADACLDLAYSSNVLEHVAEPEDLAREMLRVTKRGGTVLMSWTPWLSPWGGHETAPWHYVSGRYAADRYAARLGHRPKNDFGRSLFACSIGRMSRWAKMAEAAGDLRVVALLPCYHPAWARWVVRVPGLREVVSWNAVLVLAKQ